MWLNWLKDQLKMSGKESFAQREQVEIVAPPQQMVPSSHVYIFLTNYDVGERTMRKEKAFVTISCKRKMNF